MAQVGTLSVWLTANAKQFNAGLGKAQRSVKAFASSVMGVGGMISGLLGVGGAGMLAKSSIAALGVQEEALAKLGAVIRATGGAAGYSVKEMHAFAGELQNVTTYGDETIEASMALLATFKKVKGDEFKAATRAALDMATVMGGDPKQSILQLGKALEDPIRGMTALRRSGVSFSKEQVESIKKMVAAGNLQLAQQTLLAEVNSQFGGAAAAAADTTSGKIAQMANKWSDVKEMIGYTLVESLRLPDAMDWLLVKLGALQEWFAAGHGVKWLLEIEYGFRKAQVVLAMLGENIAAPFIWLQENGTKVWENMLSVAIAFGQDLLHNMMLPLKLYFDFWRNGWTAAWEFVKSGGAGGIGGFVDGLMQETLASFAKNIGEVGSATEAELARIGTTKLEFNSFGDMADAMAGLDAEMQKRLAAIVPPFAKQLEQAVSEISPDVTSPKAREEGPARFAAAVEAGSLEAYKAALPQRDDEQTRLAKESLEVEKKQLEAMGKFVQLGGGGLSLAAIGV